MPVTSLHIFSGAKKSTLTMLKSFGLLRMGLQRLPGIIFIKTMGCGRGAAFSIWPDWQRYAVMMECATDEDETRVFQTPLFQQLLAASSVHRYWRLAPVRKHGAWSGQNPFTIEVDHVAGGQVAVLTRAAISIRQVPAFVRYSRQTTKALEAAPGLVFSVGMGEYPLVRQATFSIWESDAAMLAYAYKDPLHIVAMKAKAKGRMFTEEMFVRFRIADSSVII